MTFRRTMTLDDGCEFIVDCLHHAAPNKNPRPKGRGIGLQESGEGTPQGAGNLPAVIQEEGYPSIRTPNIGKGRLILDGLNRDFAYSRPMLCPTGILLHAFLEIAMPIHAQLDKLDEMNQKLRTARDLLLPRLMSGEIAV